MSNRKEGPFQHADGNVNPADNILDSCCSMSEADDSGHFTASPEGDCCESEMELIDLTSHPSRTNKEFSCQRISTETRGAFEDDGNLSIMSAPGILRGITKRLEKSNQTHRSVSNENLQSHKNQDNQDSECGYPSSYLGEVLHDFNSMFQEKLSTIEKSAARGDTQTKMLMMDRKNEVLEQWAKDVCSQNMLLVHTVEELEEEANRKVKTLQGKINATTNLARSHMEMIQQYEKQVEELLQEQSSSQKKYELLAYEHMEVSKNYKSIQQRLHTSESDNDSLKTLMCRIRDMGVWDVNGLQLQSSTYDLLFGLYPNLAGSEVQTVFTREKARSIFDTEMKAREMTKYIDELKDAKKEVENTLEEKNRTIIALEAEVNSLSTLLKHYQAQCDDFRKALEETQDKLIQVTNKSNMSTVETREELQSAMSKRDQDIKDMLNELRDLKNQLKLACEERQGAIYEAKMLKHELGDRTSEMLEMRNILQIIQNEAECTRSAVQNVQDKQGHLSVLKEKVQEYQGKYEQAQALLSSKSELIQSLQQQMATLHEKVHQLEGQTLYQNVGHGSSNTESLLNSASVKNLIPKIIDNSIHAALRKFEFSAKEGVAKMLAENSETDKPAWTSHFTKASIQSSSTSASKPKVPKNVDNLEKNTPPPKTNKTEWHGKPLYRKASVPIETNKSIIPSVNTTVSQTSDPITKRRHSFPPQDKFQGRVSDNKNVKLPKIVSNVWAKQSRNSKNVNTGQAKSAGFEQSHLPRIAEKSPKSRVTTISNIIDNPMAQRNALNNLIEMAVRESKRFESRSPYSSAKANENKIIRPLPSSNGNLKEEKPIVQSSSANPFKERLNKPRKGNNSPPSSIPSEAITLTRSKVKVNIPTELNSMMPSSSWEAEDMLNQLPHQSQEDTVKKWIKSSSKTCVEMNKKMRQYSNYKFPMSGRSTHSKSSRKSLHKKRFVSSARYAVEGDNPIYSLEDEWDKTMARVTKRNGGLDEEPEKSTVTSPAIIQENGFANEENHSQSHFFVNNNNNLIKPLDHQSVEIKIQKLQEEFAMERKLQERDYLDELRNKDIEITMQKLKSTLQELKDNNMEILLQAEIMGEKISAYEHEMKWEKSAELEKIVEVLNINNSENVHYSPTPEANNAVASGQNLELSLMTVITELEGRMNCDQMVFQRREQELCSDCNQKLSVLNGKIVDLETSVERLQSENSYLRNNVRESSQVKESSGCKECQTESTVLTYSRDEVNTECTIYSQDIVETAHEKLVELKRAYNFNEEVLQNKISRYAAYAEKLRSKIIQNNLETISPIELPELVAHLNESVQYYRELNKVLSSKKDKLEAEAKIMRRHIRKSIKTSTKANQENTSLRETIAALSIHVEQLLEHNEKLLCQIHHQHKDNPCTSSANKCIEKGCGDSCKCEHSESSDASSSILSLPSHIESSPGTMNISFKTLLENSKMKVTKESDYCGQKDIARNGLATPAATPATTPSKIPRPVISFPLIPKPDARVS